jgi:hypothetical protein
MTAVKSRRRRPQALASGAQVQSLDAHRIERALPQRSRYRYVHPRVVAEGAGWKVVSPNCSRNVDPAGGDIDIAWLVPDPEGGWLLHARDHARQCWVHRRSEASLALLLAHLCADPQREYWQ